MTNMLAQVGAYIRAGWSQIRPVTLDLSVSPNQFVVQLADQICNNGLNSLGNPALRDLGNPQSWGTKQALLLMANRECPGIQSERDLVCKIQGSFPGCPNLPDVASETINTLSPVAAADDTFTNAALCVTATSVMALIAYYLYNRATSAENGEQAAFNNANRPQSTYEKTKQIFSRMASDAISWSYKNRDELSILLSGATSVGIFSYLINDYRVSVSNRPITPPYAGIDNFAQSIINLGLLSAPRTCLYDLSDALCTGETKNVLSYISENVSLLYKYTNASFFPAEKARVCEILNTFPDCPILPRLPDMASKTVETISQVVTDDTLTNAAWFAAGVGATALLGGLYLYNQKRRAPSFSRAT